MTVHAKNVDHSNKIKRFQLESPYRISIPMLILTLFLICFGLIMLFSASMAAAYNDANGNPLYYVLKQGAFTLLGIVAACVIVFIPVKWYDHIGFVIFAYILTLGLVIYTKFKGIIVVGSRRWSMIGSQS